MQHVRLDTFNPCLVYTDIVQYLCDTSTPPGSISLATYNPVLVIQASLRTVDHMIHPSGTWSPTSDSNEATKFVLSIKVPKVQNQGTRTGNSKLSVFLHHSYNWISSFKFWGSQTEATAVTWQKQNKAKYPRQSITRNRINLLHTEVLQQYVYSEEKWAKVCISASNPVHKCTWLYRNQPMSCDWEKQMSRIEWTWKLKNKSLCSNSQ